MLDRPPTPGRPSSSPSRVTHDRYDDDKNVERLEAREDTERGNDRYNEETSGDDGVGSVDKSWSFDQ